MPETIVPGGDWYDTSGNIIYATEGGIIQVGGLYYLWGMDRSQNNSTFIGVNLYSSPDLKNWTFVNTILSSSSNTLLGGGATIERAKILYNASTNQYVMWMHYEDHNAYNVAEVAYATCSTIGGNYTFQNHFQPMGIDSRDMDVYQDTDGTAYLLCSTNGNQNITIFQLDPTYTSVVGEVFTGAASNGFSCEGHAMIKTGGTYFWITSLCSGWAFNDNHYYYATSLAGPWMAGGDIAPAGDETYESQVCWAMPITGSGQTSFIYMGDRWSVDNFSMSRMVMLPIQVTGTSLKVPWYDQWDIDAAAGTTQADPQVVWNGNYYIVNRNSGKVLDVYNYSSAPGTIVDQYTNNGGANQQWTIKNIGGSDYQITNVNSGLLLEINGAATVAGSFADQYTINGGFNQKWHIIDS
ncbi:MAG TPA: RICIN domain-containing protein, partial [bacterium]|nr:RICIN domain-containing protein [bacterium]